ncbi:MAG TPA: class I SAM-dependent methyltransferase [Polyangiaceae bacterium]|nr:class I SAM-dependent methyltransferase [Polyangiaceae bacterium]
MDNATAHSASDYEREVVRTIPLHAEIQRTAIDVALAARPSPRRWLDTGAGPGRLVELAAARSPATEFWAADPSEAMLSIARTRVAPERVLHAASDALPDASTFGGPLDVITAVLCHHYGDLAARERAVARCRELLAPGGALVVFENVRAETDLGHRIQRARWADWQRAQGRDEATIEKHLAREGTAFFPIRVTEHLALFARTGFTAVELVFRTYGQAGFLAVAPARFGA